MTEIKERRERESEGGMGERKRVRERERESSSLQEWTVWKPGMYSSILISHMGGRDPSAQMTSYCFPSCVNKDLVGN